MSTFTEWILEEMQKRGMSQADLARETKRSRSAVSGLINQKYTPGVEFCSDIAKAFGIPPEVAFRKAGILPPIVSETPALKELSYLASQMPDQELDDLIAYARHRLEIAEKRGTHAAKKQDH